MAQRKKSEYSFMTGASSEKERENAQYMSDLEWDLTYAGRTDAPERPNLRNQLFLTYEDLKKQMTTDAGNLFMGLEGETASEMLTNFMNKTNMSAEAKRRLQADVKKQGEDKVMKLFEGFKSRQNRIIQNKLRPGSSAYRAS